MAEKGERRAAQVVSWVVVISASFGLLIRLGLGLLGA